MRDVRSKTGTPTAEDFRSAFGTPIVVDQTTVTGAAYFLDSGGNIIRVPAQSTTSWTPSDASGAGLTFTSVSGWYSRTGDLVIATANFTYPATVDASAAVIGGLPFAVLAGALPSCVLDANQGKVIVARGVSGQTKAALYSAEGAVAMTNADMTGVVVKFTLAYRT